jgi:ribulose-phosphate 3-epimerase
MKKKNVLIAPSILSADFARLGDETRAVGEAGADIIHVDVMDGRFVPNMTIGPCVVEGIRRVTGLPLDVHLMIEEPGRYAEDFIKAGADMLTVHAEACPHLHRNLQQIAELSHRHGARETGRSYDKVIPGVAINPHTPACQINGVLPHAGLVLVMTVNPGFGGQKFIASSAGKIAEIAGAVKKLGLDTLVEVDGGINPETAGIAARAGARVLVAGAAVFRSGNYSAAISAIRSGAKSSRA